MLNYKKISDIASVSSVLDTTIFEAEASGLSVSISFANMKSSLSPFPIGMGTIFYGASAPAGWLLCDGSAYYRSAYSALYSVIGTTYGTGDGSNTFNVPDLRETAPVGVGTSSSSIVSHDTYTLGQFKDDQFQPAAYRLFYGSTQQKLVNTTAVAGGNIPGIGSGTDATIIQGPEAYSSYGTPRYGTTTRGKRIGVNYIIRYI